MSAEYELKHTTYPFNVDLSRLAIVAYYAKPHEIHNSNANKQDFVNIKTKKSLCTDKPFFDEVFEQVYFKNYAHTVWRIRQRKERV
jgi:hypothetical protein